MTDQPTWADEVTALYVRHPDMETAEYEALMDVAVRGERPDHPNLPAYLPLALEYGLR